MASHGPTKERPGRLFVLSGPSGVGKDALLDRLRETGAPYHFAITSTTRPMRPDERDGEDYIFVTRPRFEEMIGDDELLEWAEVHGHLYGVPRSQLAGGRDVVLQVDVQGAATIRKLMPDAVFMFLEPPDMDELERRLSQRMTESPDRLRLRLRTAAAGDGGGLEIRLPGREPRRQVGRCGGGGPSDHRSRDTPRTTQRRPVLALVR